MLKTLKLLQKESLKKQKYLFTLVFTVTVFTFYGIEQMRIPLGSLGPAILLMLLVYDGILAIAQTMLYKLALTEGRLAGRALLWVDLVKVWKVKSPIYYM